MARDKRRWCYTSKKNGLTIETDDVSQVMLYSNNIPFNTAFDVDVTIQTIQDKPAAYKIVKLHNYFDISEN